MMCMVCVCSKLYMLLIFVAIFTTTLCRQWGAKNSMQEAFANACEVIEKKCA